MQRVLVVYCDFLARSYVSKRDEKNVVIGNLHISIRLARMIDVVSAIPAPTAIQTPTFIDATNPEFDAVGPTSRFRVRDSLASVFCNLVPMFEVRRRKTASADDGRFFYRETRRKVKFHGRVYVRRNYLECGDRWALSSATA